METPRVENGRIVLRWVLALAYLIAGVAHIAIPAPFLKITPAWVPFPADIILLTGICEIAGAAALLTPRLRWWAGVMLAAYALCVYPANIKHGLDQVLAAEQMHSLWYHIPRLLFQPVIIWWALFTGEVTSWPFAAKRPTPGF
jgi:uncharacterized membrane protein